jgi:hypothetical protein
MSLTSAASTASRATFPMESGEYRHARNRRTILVASANSVWASVIGEMVAQSGFTPAYPAERETPWLVVTRTHPCIAICDCDVPVDRIQRLMLEAWARHVPVLVTATGRSNYARSLKPKRVARFRLPMSPEAFRSMLERLLRSVTTRRAPRGDERDRRRHHVVGDGRNILPAVRQDLGWPGHRETGRTGRSDASDNARADDDGMAGSGAASGDSAL